MKIKLLNFVVALTFLRFSSFYSSFIYRISLNADFLFAWRKLTTRRSFVTLYWAYKVIKSFVFCTFFNAPLTDNSSSGTIGRTVFVVDKSDNWVLRGLATELIENIKSTSPDLDISIRELTGSLLFSRNSYARYIAMHQSIAVKLQSLGISPSRIIVYYTHTRSVNESSIRLFNKCHNVFFQSDYDLRLHVSNGLSPFKATYFPIGFNPSIFPPVIDDNSFSSRAYDFVFSLPYIDYYSNPHYYVRKSLPLIEAIISNLSETHKVLIIGSGWDDSPFVHCANVDHLNTSYQEKRTFLLKSKCFVCLSFLEGGPIPLLEALSSGCIVASTPVGFAAELRSLFNNSLYLFPFSKLNKTDLCYDLVQFLESSIHHQYSLSRQDAFQLDSSFGIPSLSKKLLANL